MDPAVSNRKVTSKSAPQRPSTLGCFSGQGRTSTCQFMNNGPLNNTEFIDIMGLLTNCKWIITLIYM